MDTVKTKADVLQAIERERASWDALVAAVGDDGMERPGAMGDWTFKDVVGHLNGWRGRWVRHLEAAARNEPPPAPEWPADLDDDTDAGVERVNQWLYQRDRDRPASEVLAETQAQFDRMTAAVQAIPEENLFKPNWFSLTEGLPVGPELTKFTHFHEEHEPAIREWLAQGQ